MSKDLNVICISIVLFCKLSLFSTSFVHQIINGSLSDDWKLNLTLFVDEFKGMILYCIDCDDNQFRIEIRIKTNNEIFFILQFNKVKKSVPLLKLCGCTPCNGRKMTVDIRMHHPILNITCNKYAWESFSTVKVEDQFNHEVDIRKSLPTPMDIYNSSNKIYFMVGNIGPYITDQNTTHLPMREQLRGCVDKLLYNNDLVSLVREGTNVRPSCHRKCNDDTCNGGLCLQGSQDELKCDCSKVALNGLFCDREMRVYRRGDGTTYKKKEGATEMYLKMTWKQLLPRSYCLMEVIGEGPKYVSLNSSFVSNNIIDEINFVTVNVTKGHMYVKVKNKTLMIDLSLDTNARINIGFSERSNSCEEFEGAYDIDYNPSNLVQIDGTYEGRSTVATSNSRTSSSVHAYYISTAIIVGSMLLFTLIIIILFVRNKHEMKTQMADLTKISTTKINELDHVVPESDYGMVDDEEYDCIQETEDIYARISQ